MALRQQLWEANSGLQTTEPRLFSHRPWQVPHPRGKAWGPRVLAIAACFRWTMSPPQAKDPARVKLHEKLPASTAEGGLPLDCNSDCVPSHPDSAWGPRLNLHRCSDTECSMHSVRLMAGCQWTYQALGIRQDTECSEHLAHSVVGCQRTGCHRMAGDSPRSSQSLAKHVFSALECSPIRSSKESLGLGLSEAGLGSSGHHRPRGVAGLRASSAVDKGS
mmetsp:Transcript_91432/g.158652  ORF Transcript_91432/g.158652 Transcript_91432/m.158652 type:complete len:219 (+) Transcript_91432:114-770(+)